MSFNHWSTRKIEMKVTIPRIVLLMYKIELWAILSAHVALAISPLNWDVEVESSLILLRNKKGFGKIQNPAINVDVYVLHSVANYQSKFMKGIPCRRLFLH